MSTFIGDVFQSYNFLSVDYFINNDRFDKFQDIKGNYFLNEPSFEIFVSHRWLDKNNPDPEMKQFNQIRKQLHIIIHMMSVCGEDYWRYQHTINNLVKLELKSADYKIMSDKPLDLSMIIDTLVKNKFNIGVFYDYSCMPQGVRDDDERELFSSMLSGLNNLISNSYFNIIIPNDEYFDRTWCIFELLIIVFYNPAFCMTDILSDNDTIILSTMNRIYYYTNTAVRFSLELYGKRINKSFYEALTETTLDVRKAYPLEGYACSVRPVLRMLDKSDVTNGSDKLKIIEKVHHLYLNQSDKIVDWDGHEADEIMKAMEMPDIFNKTHVKILEYNRLVNKENICCIIL